MNSLDMLRLYHELANKFDLCASDMRRDALWTHRPKSRERSDLDRLVKWKEAAANGKNNYGIPLARFHIFCIWLIPFQKCASLPAMKKPVKSRASASGRFLTAAARVFINFTDLGAFYGTSVKALEKDQSRVSEQWREEAKKSAATGEFEEFKEMSQFFTREEIMIRFSDLIANRSVRMAKRTIDSAALVFAHTLLDDALSESCRIAFLSSPKDWYGFVQGRKVDVGALRMDGTKNLIHKVAAEHVRQLSRESMARRLEVLNQICVPRIRGKKNPAAWLRREDLARFDEMRHRIIHGRYFSRPVPSAEKWVQFAKDASLFVLLLVAYAYRLTDKHNMESKFAILRPCALCRREYPEFFKMFEDITKEIDTKLEKEESGKGSSA